VASLAIGDFTSPGSLCCSADFGDCFAFQEFTHPLNPVSVNGGKTKTKDEKEQRYVVIRNTAVSRATNKQTPVRRSCSGHPGSDWVRRTGLWGWQTGKNPTLVLHQQMVALRAGGPRGWASQRRCGAHAEKAVAVLPLALQRREQI